MLTKDRFSCSGARPSLNMSYPVNLCYDKQLVPSMSFMFDFPAALLAADSGLPRLHVYPAAGKSVEAFCTRSPYRWRQNTASVMGNASSLLRQSAVPAATYGSRALRRSSEATRASGNTETLLARPQLTLGVLNVRASTVAQPRELRSSVNELIRFAEVGCVYFTVEIGSLSVVVGAVVRRGAEDMRLVALSVQSAGALC